MSNPQVRKRNVGDKRKTLNTHYHRCRLQSKELQQTYQQRIVFKETLQNCLPPDSNTFLFELISVTYLIVGAIHFARTDDASMLTTLLTWAAAHVGLTKVKPLVPWVNRGNDNLRLPDAE